MERLNYKHVNKNEIIKRRKIIVSSTIVILVVVLVITLSAVIFSQRDYFQKKWKWIGIGNQKNEIRPFEWKGLINEKHITEKQNDNKSTKQNQETIDFFTIQLQNLNAYYTRVDIGQKKMKKSNIIFACLGNNCTVNQKTLSKIHQLGSYFKSYSISIQLYNTNKECSKIYKNNDCKVMKEIFLNIDDHSLSIKRFNDLGVMRNILLDDALQQEINDYNNEIYFCMFEMKDIDIDLNGFSTCFAFTNVWDAMCANGLYINHPSYLSKIVKYDTIEWLDASTEAQPMSVNDLNRKSVEINYEQNPERIKSGYGGMIIYNLSHISNSDAMYTSSNNSEFLISEHVGLHLTMIKAGLDGIYMNPSFLVRHNT